MKVLLAYAGDFTSDNSMGRVDRMIKKKWPNAEVEKVDYTVASDISLNGYNAIVPMGIGRLMPPALFELILGRDEAKDIPVYLPIEQVLFPAEQRAKSLEADRPMQPGVNELRQLSDKDVLKMRNTGMTEYMTMHS